MKRRRRIGKKQIACIALGIVCYLLTICFADQEESLQNGYIKRNSYGEGQAQYELQVSGLGEEDYPLVVELEERVYGEEEAAMVLEEVISTMGDRILGDNVSFMEVRRDLNLISVLPQEGVQIRWSSGNMELLDSFGHICTENIAVEGVETYLAANLSTGRWQQEYHIPIRVYPPNWTGKEALAAGLKQEILGLEKQDRTREGFWLPTEYDGKQLHYREQTDSHSEILLVLGVVLAVLCYAQDQHREDEKKRAREKELMLDYAEVIFKLMVFIGAGMTVSMAWEHLVLDYENRRKHGRTKKRAVYEEMERSVQQMKSGVSEGQAYAEFGKRCQLQPYLKLSSLLEQNRKTGTKNLRSLLSAEMAEAWAQRKTIAKRMGEEAGTKLLLPLFMMLGIVMVMIMVPAMLSMQ